MSDVLREQARREKCLATFGVLSSFLSANTLEFLIRAAQECS